MAYGVVGSRSADGTPGEDDTNARWTCDDVIASWADISPGRPLPLLVGHEQFVVEEVVLRSSRAAFLEGGSANLACLLHLIAMSDPAAWRRVLLDAFGVAAVWATGKISRGGLEQIDWLGEKLRVVADRARREGGEHWFFVPVQTFEVGAVQAAFPEVTIEVVELAALRGATSEVAEGMPMRGRAASARARVRVVTIPGKGLPDLVRWILDEKAEERVEVARGRPTPPGSGARLPVLGVAAALVLGGVIAVWAAWPSGCPEPVDVRKDLDACRDLIGVNAYADARVKLGEAQAAAFTAFGCWDRAAPEKAQIAEQVLRALYLRAFVDYIELLDCAGLYQSKRAPRQCSLDEGRQLFESIGSILGRDHSESFTMLQRRLEPYAAADCAFCQRRESLAVNSVLRFGPGSLEGGTMARRFEEAIRAQRCSDYTQGWNLWLALLAERLPHGDPPTIYLSRILDALTHHVSQDPSKCPGLTQSERADRLVSVGAIGVPEVIFLRPDDESGGQRPAKELACAAYWTWVWDAGGTRDPIFEARCGPLAEDSVDVKLVRLMRANLDRRARGEPWLIDKSLAEAPSGATRP